MPFCPRTERWDRMPGTEMPFCPRPRRFVPGQRGGTERLGQNKGWDRASRYPRNMQWIGWCLIFLLQQVSSWQQKSRQNVFQLKFYIIDCSCFRGLTKNRYYMTKNLNASFKLANTLFVCITVFIVMAIFNETFLIYANSLLLFKPTNTLLIDYTTLIMWIAIIIRIKKHFCQNLYK